MTGDLDQELLAALDPAFFVERIGLKLGTENFCDRELRRLGKPYDYRRIKRLAAALAARGIRQEHYRILCNRETSLDDLLDNFERLAELRWAIGPDFFVLAPSWLINLYPTDRYRACQIRGTDLDQPTVGALRASGFPEFDYPFVIPEAPAHAEVFEIVRRFPAGMHFGAAGEPAWMFDGVHGPEDDDYLRVFDLTRRVLVERRDALLAAGRPEDGGERFRIERALATRLAGDRWMPQGLLALVAPRLELAARRDEELGALEQYLRGLLEAARAAGDLGARVTTAVVDEGVSLRVEQGEVVVDFLVQRWAEDLSYAFCSRNLAFIARSGVGTEEQRRGASAVMDELCYAVERHDTHELE